MSKKLAVLALVVGLMLPSFAAAADDYNARIQALMEQIAALQEQLKSLQAAQPAPTTWCHTFNTNLRVGEKSTEVTHLVLALWKEKVTAEFKGLPAGEYSWDLAQEFNEELASYVTAFQQKYTSEILTPNGLKFGTGFAGKSTRAKLNALYGCNKMVTPGMDAAPGMPTGTTEYGPVGTKGATASLTLLSPNGGETFTMGASSYVRPSWIYKGPASNNALAYLRGNDGMLCQAVIVHGTGSENIQFVISEATLHCGTEKLAPGDYKMLVYISPSLNIADAIVTDQSDAYFTVKAASTVSQ